MGTTRITILVENTAVSPLGITGEHGFSALIEKDGHQILLDTGQGMSLENNARRLGIDLTAIDTVVLSHGHYDHTGGLPAVLYPPRGVRVIAHPDIFALKYAELDTPRGKAHPFVGIRLRPEFLEHSLQAVFDFKTEFTKIGPGIFFSGEVPRKTDFEKPDTRLKVEQNGELVPDPLKDDSSLLIETDSGPVVISGCAHAGIINTLNHFSGKTGHQSFHAVIGGTHLGFMGGPGPQLEQSMQALESYNLKLIAVSHCTGQEAAAICYNRFKERFAFAAAGWSVDF